MDNAREVCRVSYKAVAAGVNAAVGFATKWRKDRTVYGQNRAAYELQNPFRQTNHNPRRIR